MKIVVGDQAQVLRLGEWGDWLAVELPLAPMTTLPGQVRFLLKGLTPYFELYASPINLDPFNPALPISSPEDYASELARVGGRYYTQGHARGHARHERRRADRPMSCWRRRASPPTRTSASSTTCWAAFADGLLFYYFGHVDQVSHMMWRAMDPTHPAYTDADANYRHVIEDLYVQMDGVVGRTAAALGPQDLLVVMSDHGFAPWRRAMNLNSWLRDQGYLTVTNARAGQAPGLAGVDWTRTRAYAAGLNGLYVNTQGREGKGIVPAGEREAIATEIAARLQATVDPATGQPAVTRAFLRERAYPGHAHLDLSPDIVVGYARGTRVSSDSALGIVAPDVFSDNREAWSGDHSMDPDHVPGVLFTSRALKAPAPGLQQLAASILAEFGVTDFPVRRAVMFGSRVKLDKALLAKLKRYSDLAGYSSVEEFITHALEKEIAQLEGAESEQELKKKLKGLGYLS